MFDLKLILICSLLLLGSFGFSFFCAWLGYTLDPEGWMLAMEAERQNPIANGLVIVILMVAIVGAVMGYLEISKKSEKNV